MNGLKLKDNEIMIFTDFNNTLVDFENEYNFIANNFDEERLPPIALMKINLTRCLHKFERETGLKPVICVVTNASSLAIDSNNYSGISHDMRMTFFNHTTLTPSQARDIYETTCEKYFRYLLYRENDYFFKINPLAETINDMFVPVEFSEKEKQIKMIPQFKKKESVERMLSLIDPNRDRVPRAIFAGDSIKDDYPMKLANTQQDTSKIFIRPGKAKIMKPSIIYEFCRAKGIEFSSVHPRTGKKIQCFDENTIKYLNPHDKKAFENYSDGDVIFLTSKNSQGLIEGLYKAIDIILEEQALAKQML